MILVFVGMYLLINVFIGFWASKRVKNSEDFALAGRSMSIVVASVSIFATWFGAETIMSSSVEIGKHGVLGIIKDPFGPVLCLILIGTFFARRFYKYNIVTFSDYFKLRYGGKAELISAILLSFSYLWWVAAQLQAMGNIFITLTAPYDLGLTLSMGVAIGSILIAVYTSVGGMWAVSITDFVQAIVILVGLVIISVLLTQEVGGVGAALDAQPEGFFNMLPGGGVAAVEGRFEPVYNDWSFLSVMGYIAAWLTIGIGSIPQQDVFQRTMSTRSPRAARNASYAAALLYLVIAMFPLYIGVCSQILPGDNGAYMLELTHDAERSSQMLPKLAELYTPAWVQVIFMGALVSAIMSTASGAILAPATIVTENFVRPLLPGISDRGRLRVLRLSVAAITLVSALISMSGASIYDLSADAFTITLVSLLVPLVAGVYTRRASFTGSMVSMLCGITTWAIFKYGMSFEDEWDWAPMFAGLGMSILGMLVGSLIWPQSTPISPQVLEDHEKAALQAEQTEVAPEENAPNEEEETDLSTDEETTT